MEIMVTPDFLGWWLVDSLQLLVIKKLLKKPVERHFKHLQGHHLLWHYDCVALIAKAVYRDFLNFAFIFKQFFTLNCCVSVFLEFQFNAAITMVEIVGVLYARSTTVFVGAQLVRFGCEIFNFPEQSLVLSN